MKKWLFILGLLLVVNLIGCSEDELSGEKPPEAFVDCASFL